MQVAHALEPVLLLHAVAGEHFAVGVDEEVFAPGLAGEHALAAANVINQPKIEERAKPGLGVPFLEKTVGQFFEVACNLVDIGNDVIVFLEVERVVEGGGGELHVQAFGQLIQPEHVGRIVVAHRYAEADILHSHLAQAEKDAKAAIEAAGLATQVVVFLRKSFDAYPKSEIGKFLGQLEYTVFVPAAGGNHHTFGFGKENADDLVQIFANKGFASGDVDRGQFGEFFQQRGFEFIVRLGGAVPDVAHFATHWAAIGYDYGGVHVQFSRVHSNQYSCSLPSDNLGVDLQKSLYVKIGAKFGFNPTPCIYSHALNF